MFSYKFDTSLKADNVFRGGGSIVGRVVDGEFSGCRIGRSLTFKKNKLALLDFGMCGKF